MIVHVWRRAIEADVGPVLVAADSPAIVEAITARGGQAVLTGLHHQSGSDRIFEAISRFDPDQRHDVVINVQGDLPTIEPAPVRAALKPLDNPLVDIATLACVITREDERTNPNVVKVVGTQIAPDLLRALYFTRASAPYGDGPLLHHIGLYAYRRASLSRFVSLPPSPLEQREKLEQLRALEAGLRIDVALVDTVHLGVDTAEDLERARAILGQRQ
jgi:3-deoxy-manno-octulosonate cytidylyltransferase (CMP-KDO synthetase)